MIDDAVPHHVETVITRNCDQAFVDVRRKRCTDADVARVDELDDSRVTGCCRDVLQEHVNLVHD